MLRTKVVQLSDFGHVPKQRRHFNHYFWWDRPWMKKMKGQIYRVNTAQKNTLINTTTHKTTSTLTWGSLFQVHQVFLSRQYPSPSCYKKGGTLFWNTKGAINITTTTILMIPLIMSFTRWWEIVIYWGGI